MHIEFECSGGYAGLRLAYQVEIETLSAAEAEKLKHLIEAAKVFDLNQKEISQKFNPIPDDFSCRLTLSTAEQKKILSFNELNAPENLRRLSAHLRKLAIQKKDR